MSLKKNLFAIFLSFLLLLSGCTKHWQQSGLLYVSYENLWKTCEEVVSLQGYMIEEKNIDTGFIKSSWLDKLHPLRTNGTSTRVFVQIVHDKKNQINSSKEIGLYYIEIRVEKRKNYASHDLSSSENAIWLEDGYVPEREAFFIKWIESKIVR